MKRKLLLFGNGLGRALNPEKYVLEKAMEAAWGEDGILSAEQKSLIHQCLPTGVFEHVNDVPPQSEGELDALQRVVSACDEIQKYQQVNGANWLTDHGQSFPTAIRRFIHSAACYFHEGSDVLPQEFLKPLISHVAQNKSHVVTLNYDELLYRSFVGTTVFNGYNCLIDGFKSGTFSDDNLNRYYPSNQGYYLHLHGSPLYLTDTLGDVRKYGMSQVSSIKGTSSIHLVLTHLSHKKQIIRASPILREYWERLEEAMRDVNQVLLFGYGGEDKHLNELLTKNFSGEGKTCLILQYVTDDSPEVRQQKFQYWKSKLGNGVKVLIWFLDEPLAFTNWDYVYKEAE